MLRPLLKWAGGKRQVLAELLSRLPEKWETYFEPFVGGGALLCRLYFEGRATGAVISDLNGELINFYTIVRDEPTAFITELHFTGAENTRESFEEMRRRFNQISGMEAHRLERAVLFLYFNRHAYNGLWRENRKGEFNVPFGRYKKPGYPQDESIREFSSMLSDVVIMNSDFAEAVNEADPGDFIYFDPPYEPESATASFTDYNRTAFGRDEQKRLALLCRDLDSRGIRFMVSNSSTDTVKELYHGFNICEISAARAINSRGDRRNGASELIITNYAAKS